MPPPAIGAADALFLTFIFVSAATDLFYQKIYNKSIVFFLAAAVFLVITGRSVTPATDVASGFALGFVALLPFYFVGAMGPGDVKFLAVAGAYLGPQNLIYGALYGAIAGGVGAAAVLARRKTLRVTARRTWEILKSFFVTGGSLPPPPTDSLKLPYAFFLSVGLLIRFIEIRFGL